jgi:hypothetical protein
MPDVEIGSLTIGGILLDTDPEVYESYLWAKRGSTFRTLGKTVRTQEFGTPGVDLSLSLESGPRQFIHSDTVRALDQIYRTPGWEGTLEDWLGNEFTVYFPPGDPAAFHPRHAQITEWWTYTMRLNVRVITMWLGALYAGEGE